MPFSGYAPGKMYTLFYFHYYNFLIFRGDSIPGCFNPTMDQIKIIFKKNSGHLPEFFLNSLMHQFRNSETYSRIDTSRKINSSIATVFSRWQLMN